MWNESSSVNLAYLVYIICDNSTDIEFFLGVYFFGAPCRSISEKLTEMLQIKTQFVVNYYNPYINLLLIWHCHNVQRLQIFAVAVLGKNIWGGGAGPSSFGRQQWLSEITTELINSTSSRTTVSIVQIVQLASYVGYRNYVFHWPTKCTILHWCRHKSFSSNLNKKPSCRLG